MTATLHIQLAHISSSSKLSSKLTYKTLKISYYPELHSAATLTATQKKSIHNSTPKNQQNLSLSALYIRVCVFYSHDNNLSLTSSCTLHLKTIRKAHWDFRSSLI